jgi:hypothetical protein
MGHLTAKTLDPSEVESILRRKLQWILSACTPQRVLLVGSAASRQMTNASDVDLIVIFSSAIGLEEAKSRLFASRPRDDWPHDLLLLNEDAFRRSVEKGGGLCWLAAREGRVLFERNADGTSPARTPL